jgi:O-antigen ligase
MLFQLIEGMSGAGMFGASFLFFSACSLLFFSEPKFLKIDVPAFFLFLFLLSILVSVALNIYIYDSIVTPFLWCFGVFISYFWGGSIIKWPKVIAVPGVVAVVIFYYWLFASELNWADFFSGKIYQSHLGLFVNPNRFSILLIISFIYISVLFWSSFSLSKFSKALFFISFVILFIGILGTGSRAGSAVALVLICLNFSRSFFIGHKIGKLLYRIFSAGGVAATPFFVVLVIYLVIAGVLYGSGRDVIWQVSIDTWLQKPFLGFGFSQSVNILAASGFELSAHNAFVQLLVEGGLLALFLFFSFLLSVAAVVVSDSRRGVVEYFLLLVVIVVIFHQNFETVIFHFSPYSFLFFAFIGWTVKRRSRFAPKRRRYVVDSTIVPFGGYK